MASMAPPHDHQLGEVEWLPEVNRAVNDALADLNHGYPTLFDQIDLIVNNALAESDYGSPNLFGWMIFEDNTMFGNALAELDHHGSSNQVEQLPDPAQVQINDFIEDVQMTETNLVIQPNNTGSTSVVPEKKAKHRRKKPIRWTSEEHRLFLEGLKKYGKGDWRSISRFSVVTRTPAQVASHAQKYFLRIKKYQDNHGNSNTATTANAAAPSPH